MPGEVVMPWDIPTVRKADAQPDRLERREPAQQTNQREDRDPAREPQLPPEYHIG